VQKNLRNPLNLTTSTAGLLVMALIDFPGQSHMNHEANKELPLDPSNPTHTIRGLELRKAVDPIPADRLI